MNTRFIAAMCILLTGLGPSLAVQAQDSPKPGPGYLRQDGLAEFPLLPPGLQLAGPGLSKYRDWYTLGDARDVQRLINLDLESAEAEKALGVVPKLHNTSAGLEIYELPKLLAGERVPKATFESEARYAGLMKRPGKKAGPYDNEREGKKIAKFKTSAHTSISEAALAAFHLGRILGAQADIPVVSRKTMEIERFEKHGRLASKWLDLADVQINPHIRGAWSLVISLVKKRSPLCVTPGEPGMVYGALAINPRGESDHELFNQGVEGRAFYTALVSGRDMTAQFPSLKAEHSSNEFRSALQQLAYAGDFAATMVIDEILHMRDRFGNFSKASLTHRLDESNRLVIDKSQDGASAGIALERVLLKDNDEGFYAEPSKRSHEIFLKIRHLDPLLYERLQWLASCLGEAEKERRLNAYFVTVAGLREQNYDAMKNRVIQVARRFKDLKDQKQLLSDLSLEMSLGRP